MVRGPVLILEVPHMRVRKGWFAQPNAGPCSPRRGVTCHAVTGAMHPWTGTGRRRRVNAETGAGSVAPRAGAWIGTPRSPWKPRDAGAVPEGGRLASGCTDGMPRGAPSPGRLQRRCPRMRKGSRSLPGRRGGSWLPVAFALAGPERAQGRPAADCPTGRLPARGSRPFPPNAASVPGAGAPPSHQCARAPTTARRPGPMLVRPSLRRPVSTVRSARFSTVANRCSVSVASQPA